MKFSRKLSKLMNLGVAVIFVGVITMSLLEWTGHRSDHVARNAADAGTETFRRLFTTGEPQPAIEQSLGSLRLNTVRRGDEILIIAKEGRRVWYCNHNYFGTVLRFSESKLSRIENDEWLATCL